MKQKITALFLFATLLLSLTLVSASVTLDKTSITLSSDAKTAIVQVTNTGVASLTINATSTTIAGVQVTSDAVTILPTQTQAVTFTASSDIDDLEISDSKAITLDDKQLTINMQGDFCEYTNPNNNIKLTIDDINVIEGFGDDEDYWYPLDEVEIDVEVENRGDDDLNNIEIEWIIFDQDGNKIMDGDESDFDLDSDDSETVTIAFRIDPDDLDKDISDYVFVVKATGEDSDHDDEKICTTDSETVEARIDKFIIVDNIELTGTNTCGSKSVLSFDVYNVGDKDLDDDEVYIVIYSSVLDINEVITFDKGIDALENEQVSFEFTVPEGLEAGWYGLEILAYEDEDLGSNDIFENKEDDEAKYTASFQFAGCESSNQNVEITAALSEDTQTPKAGGNLIILATIENTGDESTQYTISVSGVSAWATATISPETVTIGAGESETVEISLDIDSDAELGEKQFTIKADYNQGSQSQDVAIDISQRSSILDHFKNNWFIYTVIIIDVILVLAIIIAITRIVSKRSN